VPGNIRQYVASLYQKAGRNAVISNRKTKTISKRRTKPISKRKTKPISKRRTETVSKRRAETLSKRSKTLFKEQQKIITNRTGTLKENNIQHSIRKPGTLEMCMLSEP
jgi:hypothetical protein